MRGSHGVMLKAQDEPEVAEAVDRLVDRRGAGGHVRDRRPVQCAMRICRHRQPRGRGDGRVPDAAVAGFRALGCAHHAESARSSAAKASARWASARRCADRDERSSMSPTATASTPPTNGWCSRRCAASGRRGRLLRGRRQHRDRRGLREAGATVPGLHCPRSRCRQQAAAARWPDIGGAAQRPAVRRAAGAATDPAAAWRTARRTRRPVPIQVVTPYNLPP